MKFFLLILPLLQSIWSFHFSIVEAISDPPLSSYLLLFLHHQLGPLHQSLHQWLPSLQCNGFIISKFKFQNFKNPTIQEGSEENQMDSHKKTFIALTVASAALGVTILILLSLWIHKKCSQKSHKSNAQSSDAEKALTLGPLLAKFNTMKVIGRKGALDDNSHVAVKKIDGRGQDAEREFENEVDLLTKIQHPNIISLLGYSSHEESKFLVYELMQNGSLETELHGPSHGSSLTWHIRMKIALDAARGLEYLHEHCNPPVIHRDLKSSNILLDFKLQCQGKNIQKLWNLLAVIDGPQNKNNLKLSGTLGYLAPEYLLDGKLTDKSDVYAFGVVLLELLLGRKPVEKLAPAQCQSIVTWAMPQLTDRSKLPGIVDPVVRDTMDLKHLYQVRKLQTQTFTFLIMLIILEGATRIDPNPEQTSQL
ncbi:putative receptor-like protein kinase [Vitis vinifera]|uniref:Putative receptor-like protein kinase n=1 Tax=Vitis vinifera TaxID=29760 RepID=A0A438KE44_VITVI|nr:putative receptor-like protein kinase [Vitis vinifera]